MRSTTLVPSLRILQFANLVALPVLACALLPASAVAALPRAIPPSSMAASVSTVALEPAHLSQSQRIELAQNRRRDSDETFDPYGKDDPNSKKWGEAAGLGNRYGGLHTRGDGQGTGERSGRTNDRGEREPRRPRGEEGGRN
jgi:hypothetical protein